jgi:Ca-activated chloride channel family protein
VKFLWPGLLWLLLAIPLAVASYLLVLRSRKKTAVRYANLPMVRAAAAGASRFRAHAPPALFLLALVALLLAAARPAAVLMIPTENETIILAMDVSGSMRANDVEPTRLAAAQAAAKSFVEDLPNSVRVGIVSFAGSASVVQPPTRDREELVAAIDRFQLQRGTAIGSAIIVSLATIFPNAGIDLESFAKRERKQGRAIDAPAAGAQDGAEPKAVAPGSFPSAAIVLLTDGQRTAGPDSIAAARFAADRGVRIFTVGIGTTRGTTISYEGWSMHVRLDEDTLKEIATITRGDYFLAGSATELRKVYQTLTTRLSMEKKETEVTSLFAAAGAVLALLGAALSLLWFNRIL